MQPLISDLPLFPLGTVLFPGGLLPLRVFEARYLDMTRACLRDKTPFGVALLKTGHEVATAPRGQHDAEPEAVGCLAEIIECDMEQLGVLLIRCRGTQRFRLVSSQYQKDGLLRGIAQPIAPDGVADDGTDIDTDNNADPDHLLRLASCAEVLGRIIDSARERDAQNMPFLEPFLLEDASWVSNRLAEVLPISMRARQQMMELEDAPTRIELVHQYMRRNQLL